MDGKVQRQKKEKKKRKGTKGMMDVVLVSVERWYGEYFQGGIGGHHDLSEARDVLNLVMEK